MGLRIVSHGNWNSDGSETRLGLRYIFSTALRRIRRPFVCGLISLLTVQAQAQSQTLVWDAPPDCPQRPEVLASVREIAGDEVVQNTSLHASGRIRQVNGAFRLEIEVIGEGGPQLRTIDAKVCRDLLGAAAVVLGLNLKRLAGVDQGTATNSTAEAGSLASGPAASGTASNSTQPPRGSSKPLSTASTVVDESEEPSDDDGLYARTMWLALPQVQLGVGSLPSASVQWGAGLGFRASRWLVSLSGRYQPAQLVQADSVEGVGASVSRIAGEIGLARSFRDDDLEWAPGVIAGMDYVFVTGSGDDVVASQASSAYPFVGAGVSGRWFVADWLSLMANLAVEVPLSRPRLTVATLGEVGQLGPANGRLSAGVEWNF